MICKACSKEIDDDSLFCTYCGDSIQQVECNNKEISGGNLVADDSIKDGLMENGYFPIFSVRMQTLKLIMLKGYLIGFVIGIIICFLTKIPLSGYAAILVLSGLGIGSLICAFLLASKGATDSLAARGMAFIKSMFRSMFANPGFIGLFVVKMIMDFLIALGIGLFIMISFPLTIVYTFIMFLLEKNGKRFKDSTIKLLDKVVPIVSTVIAIVVVFIVFSKL